MDYSGGFIEALKSFDKFSEQREGLKLPAKKQRSQICVHSQMGLGLPCRGKDAQRLGTTPGHDAGARHLGTQSCAHGV